MLKTIKQVMGLTVNHVFITNFNKFKNAVDAMGCVYMTVDKRYYHNNAIEPEQYMEINLQPGYQRLCGQHALEFVANRHESTSLIRDARDQRFLLEVKAQYGGNLFENREKFERIMGRTVETDEGLHSEAQVLELLKLLISAAGKPVRQVHFHVTQDPTFDTATQEQIDEAVSSFLQRHFQTQRTPTAGALAPLPSPPPQSSAASTSAPHAHAELDDCSRDRDRSASALHSGGPSRAGHNRGSRTGRGARATRSPDRNGTAIRRT